MKFIEDHLLNRDHQECSEESKVHVRDYARLVQNAEQHSKMYTLRRAREARIRPGKSLSRQNLPLPLSSARRREKYIPPPWYMVVALPSVACACSEQPVGRVQIE